VSTELAGTRDGIPERFVPDEMRGELIEAEHLARYRWAATIAGGRRVLDAGCGTAYGTAMLANSGAREVVGVDVAEGVLASVRPDMPESVRLEAGDLRELAYGEGSFELIVCFEVIEHFEDPSPVLDELTRVLTPDGVLLISSPNRDVYPPGNPHHHHEFRPDELAAELGNRLSNVRLLRQHAYLTAAILPDERFAASAEGPLEGVRLYKIVAGESDREMYTLALGGNGALPEMPALAMLASDLDTRRLISAGEEHARELRAHRQYIHELEERIGDRDELQRRLIDAEQRLAQIPETELRLERALSDAGDLGARLKGTEGVLDDVLSSASWRITEPLRMVKRLVRGRE
jgi:SAM-dependent methyltransferase